MRGFKTWRYRTFQIVGLMAAGLTLITCSADSNTGLWIRIISPDVAIDRAVLDVSDATTTSLAEGEVTLPEAKTFRSSPNEPPEDQLWMLILADPGQTERVRIYGAGYRQGINRKIAEGFLSGVTFSPNKIADHPTPLELTHSGTDADEDGFYIPDDCDDTRPGVNPEAREVCDGLDNNCDGSNDEGCDCTPGDQRECWPHWARAIDCEVGSPTCPCRTGTQSCAGGLWGRCENLIPPDQEGGAHPCSDDTYDCYPTCSDTIDNDCDGYLNERDPSCGGCEPGSDRSCYSGPPETENVGLCRSGRQYCIDGSYGPCEGEVLPANRETCDGRDNDCDGRTDEFEPDDMPSCSRNLGVCAQAKRECVEQGGEYFWEDCSPEDYQAFAAQLVCGPAYQPKCCLDSSCYQASETKAFCDELDNDCDGLVDNASDGECECTHDGETRTYSKNEGECREGTQICEHGVWVILIPGVLPVRERCDNLDNDCEDGIDDPPDAVQDCVENHPRAHASEDCVDGNCQIDTCDYFLDDCWGDCDGIDPNGCETPLNTLQNCGACGTACWRPNATATCSTCSCQIDTCDYLCGNCDGNDGNGCETPLDTLNNCGRCGRICWLPHAIPTCAEGTCRIQSCNSLWDDCDGFDMNGCETSLETQSDCGSCNTGCSRAHASATCSGGNCRIQFCNNLWDDCDGFDLNGCETPLQTLSNCGACDSPCSRTNATASCSGGNCHIDSCNAGWGNCDGSDGNGCEQRLDTLQHCGACDTPCSRANATATCASGSCQIVSCNDLWDDCDLVDSNGCEQSLETLQHCNSCNSTCARAHATATCSGGNCRIASCDSLWGDCDGFDDNGCETPLNTLNDCGSCNSPCSRTNATASCSGGNCHIDSCDSGWGNCDGNDNNGCEQRLNTLPHCGACDTPCTRAHATATCAGGICQIAACTNPWEDCDLIDSNGCETDLDNDPANCGGCGNSCGQNAHCDTGSCDCDPGYGDCDSDWDTGCEVDMRTDPNNCGSCGNSCGQNATCVGSACNCTSPYDNCDSDWSNGCESNTDTDANNCGGCGNSCGQNAHCDTGSCACDLGYGDCDSDWDTGCETNLGTTMHCGSCGDSCGPTSDKACILGSPNHCGCNDNVDCAATGEYCNTVAHLCAACTIPAACGDSCTDCAGQQYDKACIDSGTWRCGCNDNGDCGPSHTLCNTGTNYCE